MGGVKIGLRTIGKLIAKTWWPQGNHVGQRKVYHGVMLTWLELEANSPCTHFEP